MKLALAALLTLACLAPAWAQDAAYTSEDETTLQQCIETVNDIKSSDDPTQTASMTECIGAASGICQEAPGGDTTQGMVACNQREAAWWDQYLNGNYDGLQSTLDTATLASLKTAQRAWLKFRDAKCAFVDQLWSGGTIHSVMSSQCLMDATATRAIELADALDA